MDAVLTIVQQIIFVSALVVTGWFLTKRIQFIRRNILMGRSENRGGNTAQRLKKMLMMAFGQRQMFDRPFVGFMHFLIYAGFLLINIEVLEIVLDGILGTHRLFAPYLGSFYTFLIGFFEWMAVAVVVSCVVFWLRRNVGKVGRFTKPEMKGWPSRDANIILIWEVVLMVCLFTMNATDGLLQTRTDNIFAESHYYEAGFFAVSQFFVPLFEGLPSGWLIAIERIAWWGHILGIMAFAVYITYSKHLHIGLAFPNTFFADLQPKGEMRHMEEVTKEVNIMLGIHGEGEEMVDEAQDEEVPTFGAKDVTDLTWKNIMDAYSCSECGRCTSVCPANQTGKKLSPRKVMMDVRDRAEELGKFKDTEGAEAHDGKTLYNHYTTKEELMACTTCNACVEACPLQINPLDIILQQRRYIAMEESDTPASWNAMFSNIENNFAPWAFPASERFNWAESILKSAPEDAQQGKQ